jgi:hypothetical protein
MTYVVYINLDASLSFFLIINKKYKLLQVKQKYKLLQVFF